MSNSRKPRSPRPLPRRRTPVSDAEVEAWIAAHVVTPEEYEDAYGTAHADQVRAADRDSTLISVGVMTRMVADGQFRWGVRSGPASNALSRDFVRVMLVAQKAGFRRVCPHTRTTKPQFLVVDPGVASCVDCVEKAIAVASRLGFQYDHECDGCVKPSTTLAAVHLNWGMYTILAHLCPDCDRRARREVIAGAAT